MAGSSKFLSASLPPLTEAHIRKSVARGLFPPLSKLVRYAKSKGEVVQREQLKNYVQFYAHLAKLSSKRHTPRRFGSQSFPVYGTCFVDLAYMYPSWKGYNGGCVGFVIAVEASTAGMHVVPIRGKTKRDWAGALTSIIEDSHFSHVRTIISDFEPSLVSRAFRERMAEERDVSFVFLSRKSKSYMAEGMISWTKKAIAKATEMRRREGDPKFRNWVSLLPNIIKTFNERPARGTSFRRKDVDHVNFEKFLNEVFKTRDATMSRNTGTLDADSIGSRKWVSRLFRFSVGERVLVHRKAEGTSAITFFKPSSKGAFSETPRIIHQRVLKRTRDGKLLVPGKVRYIASSDSYVQ